jgi:hypothetical protein
LIKTCITEKWIRHAKWRIMRQKLFIYSGATNCKLLVQRYM